MFRHERLRPLSRGHHRVLVHAREMRRSPEQALPAFLAFARDELTRHLDAEERVLFPAVVARLPNGDRTVEDARASHEAIRGAVARIAAAQAPAPEAIRDLAQVLDDHVRHAERTLFPLAERLLDTDAIADLGRRLGNDYVI